MPAPREEQVPPQAASATSEMLIDQGRRANDLRQLLLTLNEVCRGASLASVSSPRKRARYSSSKNAASNVKLVVTQPIGSPASSGGDHASRNLPEPARAVCLFFMAAPSSHARSSTASWRDKHERSCRPALWVSRVGNESESASGRLRAERSTAACPRAACDAACHNDAEASRLPNRSRSSVQAVVHRTD